jgi:hypothetical protein
LIKGFLNLPWFLWALLSLGLSVLWVFVGPHTQMTADTTPRYFIVRWAHALTWLLLAASFFLRGVSPRFTGIANLLAVAGGLVYAAYILMAFVFK